MSAGIGERLILKSLALAGSRGICQTVYPFQLGSVGQEYGKCACKSPAGEIVIGILFQNSIDFDPGAATALLGTPSGTTTLI